MIFANTSQDSALALRLLGTALEAAGPSRFIHFQQAEASRDLVLLPAIQSLPPTRIGFTARSQLHPNSTPDLSQLHPNSTPDLSQLHPNSTPDMSQLNPNSTPDMSQLNPNFTPDLSQLNPNSTPDLSQLHPNSTPDLSQLNPDFSPQGIFLDVYRGEWGRCSLY